MILKMRDDGVKLTSSDQDIQDCFNTMVELRPHLNTNDFVQRVRKQMQDGYQLAFIRDGGDVICVAGFRTINNLFKGKNLYIDDLVTSSQFRSNGAGKQMLDWLIKYAKSNHYDYLSLDSGLQRERAHQFYRKNQIETVAYHFNYDIDEKV